MIILFLFFEFLCLHHQALKVLVKFSEYCTISSCHFYYLRIVFMTCSCLVLHVGFEEWEMCPRQKGPQQCGGHESIPSDRFLPVQRHPHRYHGHFDAFNLLQIVRVSFTGFLPFLFLNSLSFLFSFTSLFQAHLSFSLSFTYLLLHNTNT